MRFLHPAVYIMASQRNGTLYIGVTADLIARISVHRQKRLPGFTHRYGVTILVYWEEHGSMLEAIAREKRLKKFYRAEKIALIEATNPTWRDLWFDIAGEPQP